MHPPSRRSRWLRIRLNAVASCTTVSHCQCASVVWAFPACDWTKLGVLPPASFRDRGAHCQQCQQERRNGGTADALEPVRQPPFILFAGLMGVCVPASHAEVLSSVLQQVPSSSLSIGAVACPAESQSQIGRSRSSTGPALCRGLASSPSDLSVPCSSDSPLDAG